MTAAPVAADDEPAATARPDAPHVVDGAEGHTGHTTPGVTGVTAAPVATDHDDAATFAELRAEEGARKAARQMFDAEARAVLDDPKGVPVTVVRAARGTPSSVTVAEIRVFSARRGPWPGGEAVRIRYGSRRARKPDPMCDRLFAWGDDSLGSTDERRSPACAFIRGHNLGLAKVQPDGSPTQHFVDTGPAAYGSGRIGYLKDDTHPAEEVMRKARASGAEFLVDKLPDPPPAEHPDGGCSDEPDAEPEEFDL